MLRVMVGFWGWVFLRGWRPGWKTVGDGDGVPWLPSRQELTWVVAWDSDKVEMLRLQMGQLRMVVLVCCCLGLEGGWD